MNEELTKALKYEQNQKEGLERFLEDGRLELTNNWCESTIRPFATGRRAWLFSDTPEGAHTNGSVYTLVLSAQRNRLDVYEYLKYLLSELPNIGDEYQSKPELLDRYMPWPKEQPQECRLREKKASAEAEDPAEQPKLGREPKPHTKKRYRIKRDPVPLLSVRFDISALRTSG